MHLTFHRHCVRRYKDNHFFSFTFGPPTGPRNLMRMRKLFAKWRCSSLKWSRLWPVCRFVLCFRLLKYAPYCKNAFFYVYGVHSQYRLPMGRWFLVLLNAHYCCPHNVESERPFIRNTVVKAFHVIFLCFVQAIVLLVHSTAMQTVDCNGQNSCWC